MDVFESGWNPTDRPTGLDGSKNAALPLMAASLLTSEPVVLNGIPPLADVRSMERLLVELGLGVHRSGRTIQLHAEDEQRFHARYDIVKTMRASICTLGPMLARRGMVRISMPGGCAIGDRPVDLHLRGMEAPEEIRSMAATSSPSRSSPGQHHLPRRPVRIDRAGHGQRDVRDARRRNDHHRVRRLRTGDRRPRPDAQRHGRPGLRCRHRGS